MTTTVAVAQRNRRRDDYCPVCGYPGGKASDHRGLPQRRVIELGTGKN